MSPGALSGQASAREVALLVLVCLVKTPQKEHRGSETLLIWGGWGILLSNLLGQSGVVSAGRGLLWKTYRLWVRLGRGLGGLLAGGEGGLGLA